MWIEAGEMSDKERLKFEYSVLEFSAKNLKVTLVFENPSDVSSNSEKDSLVVRLENFRDKKGNLIAQD